MKRYTEADETAKVTIRFNSESDFNLFRYFMRNHGYVSDWTPNDASGFGADVNSVVFENIKDILKKYKINFI